jgi:hypothetical protein
VSKADVVTVAGIDIFLPTASDPDFDFMENLAERFGVETNADAEKQLRRALREAEGAPKGRVSMDHEGDFVFVRSRSWAAVLFAAQTVLGISGTTIAEDELTKAQQLLSEWRRPKAQRWDIGDVFAIPLGDATFAAGQVLGTYLVRSPTCALFEVRCDRPDAIDVDEAIGARAITILHTDGQHLASGHWRVLGRREPAMRAEAGPWGTGGTSSGDETLAQLARTYWGLLPWNVLADERYYDRLLMRGVSRPAAAKVLSAEERRVYRRDVFRIDE